MSDREHTVRELLDRLDEVRWSGLRSRPWLRWAARSVVLPEFPGAIQDVNAADAELAISRIATERGPYLANRVLSLLRVAWSTARRWGWATSDPFVGIQKLREAPRRRSLDDAEAEALESVRVRLELSPRYRVRAGATACRLILLTGARPSEVLGLRWEWVDLDAGVARLPNAKTGPRTLTLWPSGVALLRAWRGAEGTNASGWVFPSRAGGSTPLRSIRRTWDALREAAGIEDARLYDLRRTWGTAALNAGAPLEAVSCLLGHSNTLVTQRHYAHLRRETAVRAAAAAQERLAGIGKGKA